MLREALAIQLEESPFLKVLDDDVVYQDLQLMGQPRGARVTNDVAREICQRENKKAMISGTIGSRGCVVCSSKLGKTGAQKWQALLEHLYICKSRADRDRSKPLR